MTVMQTAEHKMQSAVEVLEQRTKNHSYGNGERGYSRACNI